MLSFKWNHNRIKIWKGTITINKPHSLSKETVKQIASGIDQAKREIESTFDNVLPHKQQKTIATIPEIGIA